MEPPVAPMGSGNSRNGVVDVAADLGAEDLGAYDLVLVVDLARHDEVVLPHQPRVEQAVQQVVADLRGEGAGAGDVDRDGAHRAVDDLALEDAERGGRRSCAWGWPPCLRGSSTLITVLIRSP